MLWKSQDQSQLVTKSINLAFVTDGRLLQIIGIACIINAFRSKIGGEFPYYAIWIVTPEEKMQEITDYLSSVYDNLNFRILGANTSEEDQYYIQMGLVQIFKSIKADDILLCLDYDHVILKPKSFPFFLPNPNIIVSSEVYYNVQVKLTQKAKEISSILVLPKRHLNTSLIYGCGAELYKISEHWHNTYDELLLLISARNRTEIAFSLAVERFGIPVIPCEVAIQSNFKNPNLNSCIFHYGGESKNASIMKHLLSTQAERLHKGNLRIDDIERISRLLEKALFTLI